MDYSLTQVSTAHDCDMLLDIAQLEQDDLNFKKTQQERQHRTVTTSASSVEADLVGVNAQVSGYESAIAGMTDGTAKDELLDKLENLHHKQYLLQKRSQRYGILALLQMEYSISCIEKQLLETTAYIDAVTARKGAL